MLVRKNTKSFKTIQHLITECQDRPDRDQLIRLYITKAGDSIEDRISIEGIQGDAALFYEMTYQTVLNNLKSSNHQLQVSDEIPGLYFFYSSSNKVWDETPFEFDEVIKDEFASLPELPLVRKKEAVKKFVLPSAESKRTPPPGKKERSPNREKSKVVKYVEQGPKQPDFKLKHPIEFTNLDRLIFRQAKVTKQDVLEYYNNIADYLLPWLKDRPIESRMQSEGGGKAVPVTIDALFKDSADEVPEWIKTAAVSKKRIEGRLLTFNDKEDLLLCAEKGCLEFISLHSRTKNIDSPDYIVIAIDSPDSGLEKAIEVSLTARDILTGLKLPSFIKTDGVTGFHVYVPLDSKSDYDTSQSIAKYICNLIKLKIPDVITLKGSSAYVYGKVSLDYSLNKEGKGVVAPYSLLAGQSPIVATPLLWEEVTKGLRAEDFNPRSVLRRFHDVGDPFEGFFKKKINAEDLLERLEEHYAFLI